MTIVTRSSLAAELRISRPRVTQYVARGMPIRKDGKLDRERCLEWLGRNCLSVDQARGGGLARKISQDSEALPAPWLKPVAEAANPFDQGCLFGVISMQRCVGALAAAAALRAGVELEAAKAVAVLSTLGFIDRASRLLHEAKIGRIAADRDAQVWTTDVEPIAESPRGRSAKK
jgi:hypothetical protein